MAEAGHVVFESTTTFTTSATTPTTAYTIAAAASLDTSGTAEYILILNALHGVDSSGLAGNNNRNIEVHDNGTVIGDTWQRLEPEDANDDQGNHYGLIKRFTKASAGDITLEIYNPDSSPVSVFACNAILIALDDLTENTDFLHAVVNIDDPNFSTYVDGASVTVPAGSDNWIAFAYMLCEIDDVGGFLNRIKIVDDATDRAEIQVESEDASEQHCMLTSYHIAEGASSKTVKMQYSSANGTSDMLCNEIFLLRLEAFKDSAVASGGTATVTAANTWAELENLAFTATHTGDYCVIGGGVVADAANANRRERRITSEVGGGGETTIAGSATQQLAGAGAATEDLPIFLCDNVAYNSSDSVDIDLDVGDSVNSVNESWSAGYLAAWSWELAAAGPTPDSPLSAGGIILLP